MNVARPLTRFLVAACFAACVSAACARTDARVKSRALERSGAAIVFHIVRHAEKAATPTNDPELSDAGRARARRLADSLRKDPPTTIYSTDYARTRATAAPSADRYGRRIEIYDARRPADEFADELRRRHVGGDVVLVVGHSNTATATAAALCRCDVPPMREDEYDRWLTVRIAPGGEADLRTTRY